jgi:hypothetical protein
MSELGLDKESSFIPSHGKTGGLYKRRNINIVEAQLLSIRKSLRVSDANGWAGFWKKSK